METLHILVVDDEPGMLTGVQRALRHLRLVLAEVQTEVDFTVETAASGELALERIEAHRPDILLLDHKLPGISGLDVLERLVVGGNDILTIMITAYASLETAVTAIKQGAYDFLAKPFTPGELKATIRKAASNLVHTRQARRLAQEKRRIRFDVISVLVHELKAPLAAVEGYLGILRDGIAGEDPALQHKMIARCGERMDGMRKLIVDMLDLTRIESGQKARTLSRVDVAEIARKVMESCQPAAAGRRITLMLTGPEKLAMTADAGEIEIVLNNLVTNAIKYNRDGGRVEILLNQTGGRVTLAVRDTGIGLTEEEAGRLFQDFVRIKKAETRNIPGSGLGLSIVKKIAYLYEGNVDVESRPGQGSTFTVTLHNESKVHHH